VLEVLEYVVQGKSLEEIRTEWAPKLGILPQNLTVEVIERSEYYPQKLKIRLTLEDKIHKTPLKQANKEEI
jgi:hypothetical protein